MNESRAFQRRGPGIPAAPLPKLAVTTGVSCHERQKNRTMMLAGPNPGNVGQPRWEETSCSGIAWLQQ
jgi:hypothetical protein